MKPRILDETKDTTTSPGILDEAKLVYLQPFFTWIGIIEDARKTSH